MIDITVFETVLILLLGAAYAYGLSKTTEHFFYTSWLSWRYLS